MLQLLLLWFAVSSLSLAVTVLSVPLMQVQPLCICVVCTYWCASRHDKGTSCCYRGSRAMASPRTALRLLSCFSNSSSSSNSKMLWLLWDLPSKQLCSGRSDFAQSMHFFISSLAGYISACHALWYVPCQICCGIYRVPDQYLQHVIQKAGLSKTWTTQLRGFAAVTEHRQLGPWHDWEDPEWAWCKER